MATTITAEGSLSCLDLQAIILKMDTVWPENASKKMYQAKVEALRAIRENQTVTLAPLQEKDKTNSVKLIWMEMCNDDIAACSDLCDNPAFAELQSGCETHSLSCLAEVGFKIGENTFDSKYGNYQDAIAFGMMANLKKLDERLAVLGVTALGAMAGVNQYTEGITEGTGNAFIPPQYWGPDLMGEFAMISQINRFNDAYLLSGTNLYKSLWNSEMNRSNGEGKGAANKMSSMDIYFDLFNVNPVAGKSTYMIDPNAIAFINKAKYSSTPKEYTNGANMTLYSVESKNLPGIFYDVKYTTVCTDAEVFHQFKIWATGAFLQNPTGCNDEITGILEFTCGNPVS